jgi:hypothetical protein
LKSKPIEARALIKGVERVTGIASAKILSNNKTRRIVEAKEALILVGRDQGISKIRMYRMLGFTESLTSRRYDAARKKDDMSGDYQKLIKHIDDEL